MLISVSYRRCGRNLQAKLDTVINSFHYLLTTPIWKRYMDSRVKNSFSCCFKPHISNNNIRGLLHPVVKVVLWSRGPHLTKPGWSKPHTYSNPTNLALFRDKITLYRFNQGAHTIAGGAQMGAGGWAPWPHHFIHWLHLHPLLQIQIYWFVAKRLKYKINMKHKWNTVRRKSGSRAG